MKASDNEFPSVLLDEQGAAPTTPPTGFWRVYAKSDGLYIVDDAGNETGPLGAAVGGSGYAEGIAFPGAPATGDKFFHNTYDELFFYDGTRWLCANLHSLYITPRVTANGYSATATYGLAPTLGSAGDMFLEDLRVHAFVATGGASGGNTWDITVDKRDAANAITSIGNVLINSQTANTHKEWTATLDHVVVGSAHLNLQIAFTKAGSPGNLFPGVLITFRHIGA